MTCLSQNPKMTACIDHYTEKSSSKTSAIENLEEEVKKKKKKKKDKVV